MSNLMSAQQNEMSQCLYGEEGVEAGRGGRARGGVPLKGP